MKRWFFPLVRVDQVDHHGCAIAAAATVCGLTYERMRSEFFPKRSTFVDDQSLHVDQQQTLRVLQRLGFTAKLVDDHRKVKRPAIVPFSWNNCAHAVHAIVWDPFSKRHLDPSPLDQRMSHDYVMLWRKSNYKVIVVTGRRKERKRGS